MDEPLKGYCDLLKKLRPLSHVTVRDIECYTGMSTSTVYRVEKGCDLLMSRYLGLLGLYLSSAGFELRHQELAESIRQAVRTKGSIRLVVAADPADKSGIVRREVVLLERKPGEKESGL